MTMKFVVAGFMFAAAVVLPIAAHADFYKLEGRYQCLGKAGTICGDATPSFRPPLESREKVEAVLERISPAAAPPRENPAPVKSSARHPRSAFSDLADRMQAGRPLPGDIDALKAGVKANDPHAIELLAWCDLTGTGTPRDPIEAYILYGVAAIDAVPRARHNQSIIYDTALTSDQRQQLLDIRNNDASMVRIIDGR
jgi:hypothetical protein